MSLTIPDNAPFSGTQRMWLKGFLDGINSTLTPASGDSSHKAVAQPSGHPVTIAWGSQTGTCETLGKKVAKILSGKGHIPTVLDMQEVTPEALAKTERLLLITSTYGDGEPPDNAAALHSSLHAGDAPQLPSLNYSVLALGDSSYPEFCKCGHDFDTRLAALGAIRIAPIMECDVDYDDSFGKWISSLEAALVPA
jgi:sulfite reductase (NADPH) flavoprotein alpha-component